MIEFKSFLDVLKYAIDREIEAHQLYTDMAHQAQNRDIHNVLLGFAREELRHKAKLEMEIINAGTVVVDHEELYNYEYTDHLEHYNPLNAKYSELLLTAIQKEKHSFRLYFDLACMTKDKDLRETLITIAEEEARHKVLLQVEYDTIAKI